ncbi:3'-5' exonuclease, partial [Clostridium botulinum]
KYKGIEYTKIIKENLKKNFIDYDILNKDYNKYEFEYYKDRVKISTIYSAKGLDFEAVFICGINDGLIKRKEESKKVLYVGITRARKILNITYSVRNELTDMIVTSCKEIKKDNFSKEIGNVKPKEIEYNKNSIDINENKKQNKGFWQRIREKIKI